MTPFRDGDEDNNVESPSGDGLTKLGSHVFFFFLGFKKNGNHVVDFRAEGQFFTHPY